MIYKKIKAKAKSTVKPYVLRFAQVVANANQDNNFAKRSFFKGEITEDISVRMAHRMFRKVYDGEEKIRIVFIFQAASFWPSWETFWNAVVDDDRFDARMLLCDDIIKEKAQFLTARKFLEERGIPFENVHDVNLEEIAPHVVVLQTPYDGGHRPKYLHGNNLMSRGFRVVYVTYGIEIADTYKARNDHFEGAVTRFGWRVYTFSKEMIPEYKRNTKTNGDMVRALGHPKFDAFFNAKQYEMPKDILDAAKGRKIVLWKVHFPKKVNGKLITPSPSEYFKFAQSLSNYKDLYFVFMPHPKFYEELGKYINRDKFIDTLEKSPNVTQFLDDDYRGVLKNADFHIMDRSALMVEAALTNKPVLYVSNPNYLEKMTPPVQKLLDTYYAANNSNEMLRFIDDVVLGTDPMRLARMKATKEVIEMPPEGSGVAIKNDIFESLVRENPAIPKEDVELAEIAPKNTRKTNASGVLKSTKG